jgi:ATP synthase I chain
MALLTGSVDARGRSLRLIFALLALVTVALTAGGWFWSGLDTAEGVLLGCAIVAFNLLGTAHFVSAVLAERKFKGRLVASLTIKLGLTLAVLYIAVSRWGISPVGIVVGLFSMMIVSLLYTVVRPKEPPAGDDAQDSANL